MCTRLVWMAGSRAWWSHTTSGFASVLLAFGTLGLLSTGSQEFISGAGTRAELEASRPGQDDRFPRVRTLPGGPAVLARWQAAAVRSRENPRRYLDPQTRRVKRGRAGGRKFRPEEHRPLQPNAVQHFLGRVHPPPASPDATPRSLVAPRVNHSKATHPHFRFAGESYRTRYTYRVTS